MVGCFEEGIRVANFFWRAILLIRAGSVDVWKIVEGSLFWGFAGGVGE